jgi:hypothetical protein
VAEAEVAAWRFVHPDFEAGAPSRGVVTDALGRVALAGLDLAVHQSLCLILSTAPGERLMRPDYGCPLRRLAFQPLDNTTAGLAIHYVEEAVRRWEPRAEITLIDAYPSPDVEGVLSIDLHYRVRSTRRERQLRVDLPIEGEAPR